MRKFGGFPKEFKGLGYDKLKEWFDKHIKSKCPDVDFDKEAEKIGVELPKKKADKK